MRYIPPAAPLYLPLVSDILRSCFGVLLLPPRPFRTEKPLTQNAFQVVFLQKRCLHSELCRNHGPGALLTPRLDAQTSFAKLFADIGTQEDVRHADLATLLAAGAQQSSTAFGRLTHHMGFGAAGVALQGSSWAEAAGAAR